MPLSDSASDPQVDLQTQPNPSACFRISPLIRYTLLLLWVALTLPLPVLSVLKGQPIPLWLLLSGLGIGLAALLGALSERVVLDETGIRIAYAAWVPGWFRSGWSLEWASITALKPRSTSQGGLVYYLVTTDGRGYLLPMRILGFSRLLQLIQSRTGLDTRAVKPLAQPWMYTILLVFSLLLLVADGWVLWTALSTPALA